VALDGLRRGHRRGIGTAGARDVAARVCRRQPPARALPAPGPAGRRFRLGWPHGRPGH
jgi:hypothetical protein